MADDSEPPTCFNCTLQVNETIHVKCNECPVNICMLCFQCGAESPPHRRGHNYELLKPLEDGDGMTWTHEDEFELLKAAHRFKMGNWGAIAESIGRGRREGQNCKDYFEKHFVRGWMGQFSIKSANWEKTKFEMFDKQELDSVLQKNCLESTERMLLIRDAIRDSEETFEETDPKLAIKIQQLLEKYIQKCIDNDVEIKYERPQPLKGQYETELTPDDCDRDDVRNRKSVKLEIQTDDSDHDDSPGPSCSYRRSGPPSAKKSRTTRVVMESSSDSEEARKSASPENDTLYNDLERDDQDPDADETAQEVDSEEEEEEDTKPKKGATPGKRKRRKRFGLSKKDRRLDEFRKKMNREQKQVEKKLATLGELCTAEEVKVLRKEYSRLLHENGVSKSDRPKIKQSTELSLLGYNIEREEFETEWFNEAEQLISRLTISAAPPKKDEKLDIENDIKFARLRHYIRLLGIRKAKRNTVLEHDKINEFIRWYKEACLLSKTNSISDIMDSRSEKDKLLEMTQQFLRRDEYQNLRACIEKIDGMVERIEVLQELQRNGENRFSFISVSCSSSIKKKIAMEWNKYKKWHTQGWE
ncbi:CRE-ADA-2 protein [Caenorhabditis remanei]|uniref:CRE-ADA-2 protein n=1 Tax=Caenorhabditis remanei TaxID=31234 RepID=E3LQG8_CAERE|nr:CRE-ADA-2 protein [Caenorhabditis remanei]